MFTAEGWRCTGERKASFKVSCAACHQSCTPENSQVTMASLRPATNANNVRLPAPVGIWNYPDTQPKTLVPGILICESCSLKVSQAELYYYIYIDFGRLKSLDVWANASLVLDLDVVLGTKTEDEHPWQLPKLSDMPLATLASLKVAGINLFAGIRASLEVGGTLMVSPTSVRWNPSYVFNAQLGFSFGDRGPLFSAEFSPPQNQNAASWADTNSYVDGVLKFQVKPLLKAGLWASLGSHSAGAYAYLEQELYLRAHLNYSANGFQAGSNPDDAWVKLSDSRVPGAVDCASVDHHMYLHASAGIGNPMFGAKLAVDSFVKFHMEVPPRPVLKVAKEWPILSGCFKGKASAASNSTSHVLFGTVTLQGMTSTGFRAAAAQALATALGSVLIVDSSRISIASVSDSTVLRQAALDVDVDTSFDDSGSRDAARGALYAAQQSGTLTTALQIAGLAGVSVAGISVRSPSPSPSPSSLLPSQGTIYTAASPSPSLSGRPTLSGMTAFLLLSASLTLIW
mmetsp:Transcript_116769/g.203115  ORF Transcript_116769/g.203115 Transcript_116769/m.203115 type:complete len:513 (-) Transcript_116769:221-1759(-)